MNTFTMIGGIVVIVGVGLTALVIMAGIDGIQKDLKKIKKLLKEQTTAPSQSSTGPGGPATTAEPKSDNQPAA